CVMPQLTDIQIEQSLMHLGYASIPDALDSIGGLRRDFSASVVARVTAILAYLNSSDTEIDAAASQSRVKKVGSIEFQPGMLAGSRKGEAGRQLAELGNLLGIEVLYNKYSPGSAGSGPSVVTDY
ncbi:MAG: hypothetical protein AAF978_07225, partial [Cyanobacteria bacterium P01_E01_bin.48]